MRALSHANQKMSEIRPGTKLPMKKYTLIVKGYGCDLFVGGMSQKAYEYFVSKNIDFDEYAFDWDFKPRPRVAYLPFLPGDRYAGECIFEARGAFAEKGNHIEVLDDQRQCIWRCPINLKRLSEAGVSLKAVDVLAPARKVCEAGYYVADYIKGVHCADQFSTRNDFDPSKLCLEYSYFMDTFVVFKVKYGRRILDDVQDDVKGIGACATLIRFD